MAARRDYSAATSARHADVNTALVQGRGFDWLASRWGVAPHTAYQWAVNNGVWTNQINALNDFTKSPPTTEQQ